MATYHGIFKKKKKCRKDSRRGRRFEIPVPLDYAFPVRLKTFLSPMQDNAGHPSCNHMSVWIGTGETFYLISTVMSHVNPSKISTCMYKKSAGTDG